MSDIATFAPSRVSTGATFSRFGDAVSAVRIDDVSVQFQYDNSTYDVTTTTTGTGATSNSNSECVLSTGSGVGLASVQSVEVVRYRPGHEAFAFFTAAIAGVDAGVNARIGLFDATDGFWFGCVAGVFGVGRRRGGTDFFTPQASFSEDTIDGAGSSGFTIDWTKLGIRSIKFGWLGIAPIDFCVFGGRSRGFVLSHVIDLTNTQDTPSIFNPVLPMRAEIERVSGSGAATLKTASWNAGTIGDQVNDESGSRGFTGSAERTSVTTRINMITIRNESTFQGKTNKVRAHLGQLSFACDGSKPATFGIYEDATIGGTPVFSSVDASSSTCSIDTAGTTLTGGTKIAEFRCGKTDSKYQEITSMNLRLRPGHKYTIAASAGGASDVHVSVRWHEEF
jgi:hypothetical protein